MRSKINKEKLKLKNEKGRIKLITLIGATIAILIVSLIGIMIWKETTKNDDSNGNIVSPHIEKKENIIAENKTVENTTMENPTKWRLENQTSGGDVQLKEEKKDFSDFTYAFLKQEESKKNMIYSPLSIKYALKMLQEGADGNTYAQINNVVGKLELPTYKNIDKTLSLANGIFIKDTFYGKVKQQYKDVLVNKYNAEIVKDEFKSAENANKWIENKTLGIIKNMLDDEMFKQKSSDEELVMLLINALAIDMEWEEIFSDNSTRGDTFYLEDGTEMRATMMNKETSSDNISYYIGNDVKALTMDLKKYDDTQLEFVAIMPENNLNEYVNSFKEKDINEIDKKLNLASKTEAGVKIKIPKFSFWYELKLKEDLQRLGITDAFERNLADFTNMSDGARLYVSNALHKANIDFTEKGIKAAAVTVFGMSSIVSVEKPRYPIEIYINKPFLFLIRDKNTKEVWFTGTVYEPNSWEKDKDDYTVKYDY